MGRAAHQNGSHPSAADLDDASLVRAAQADRQAFGPLYERYVAGIYRFCYHRLGSREAAEDATSLIFTKALGALTRFRPGAGSFRSWLFVIAHNTVVDVHRDRPMALLAAIDMPERDLGPEESFIAAQDQQELHQLLASLPVDQHQVMELRLSGLSSPEVGRVLGRSPTAIRSLQFRAVQRLRAALIDASVIEESPHVCR